MAIPITQSVSCAYALFDMVSHTDWWAAVMMGVWLGFYVPPTALASGMSTRWLAQLTEPQHSLPEVGCCVH